MSEQNDGGAAFPELDRAERYENRDGGHNYSFESSGGMSLRDYFAAKAIQSFLSNSDCLRAVGSEAASSCASRVAVLAAASYEIADAMLTERSK